MGRRTLQSPIFPATGGLQSASNPAFTDPNNVFDIDNMIISVDNVKRTRPGLKLFNSVTTETEGLQFIKDFWHLNVTTGSQSNQVVRIINGKFEADNNGDGAFTDKTGSFSINANDVVTSDVFAGLLIMAFQNSVPLKYDQTTLANLGGGPRQGSLFRTHADYGWLSGFPDDPHTVDRSYPGDPQLWSVVGTETITVDDGDGDPVGITALFPSYYGDLYVGKWRSLYRIALSADGTTFGVQLVLRGVGVCSHNAVVALQNDVLFASDRGVHSLATTQKFGDVESTFLSAPIQDIFRREIDFSRANEMNACYLPDDNAYVLSVPIKGYSTNSDLLHYNVIGGQWYRYRSINASRVTIFTDSEKKARLMAGLSDGRVATFDEDMTLDFDDTAIPCNFTTGILYPGGVKRSVAFKSLTCIYEPKGDSKFQVGYSVDGQAIGSVEFSQALGNSTNLGPDFILGTAPLGQQGQIRIESKPLTGNGRGIQLSFSRDPSGDDVDQGMAILGYIIEFVDSDFSDEPSVQ